MNARLLGGQAPRGTGSTCLQTGDAGSRCSADTGAGDAREDVKRNERFRCDRLCLFASLQDASGSRGGASWPMPPDGVAGPAPCVREGSPAPLPVLGHQLSLR